MRHEKPLQSHHYHLDSGKRVTSAEAGMTFWEPLTNIVANVRLWMLLTTRVIGGDFGRPYLCGSEPAEKWKTWLFFFAAVLSTYGRGKICPSAQRRIFNIVCMQSANDCNQWRRLHESSGNSYTIMFVGDIYFSSLQYHYICTRMSNKLFVNE